MSFGPRIPFQITNDGEKTQTPLEADEAMVWPLTEDGHVQTHNGRQTKAVDRPTSNAGLQPRDIYQWSD